MWKSQGVWTAFVTHCNRNPVTDVITFSMSTEHEILIGEVRNNTTSADAISCPSLKVDLVSGCFHPTNHKKTTCF